MTDTPILDQLVSELCEHGKIKTIGCYMCCQTCNLDEHRCHFCGDALRHDGTLWGSGELNPCYWDDSVPGIESFAFGQFKLAMERIGRAARFAHRPPPIRR